MEIDQTDRQIINTLQTGFPIAQRPFAVAAEKLGLNEDDLIARLARLKQEGIITRFGPFLDAAAMGGAFCLCAMEIPEAQFEATTQVVNSFEEVAHNYARDHRLNMWFVLATETPEDIGQVATRIEEATGVSVFQFPKLKEFFVGFRVAA